MAVVFFDMNYKGGNLNAVPNYKKMLGLFARVELTPGFHAFLGDLRQSKSFKLQSYSLTPSKSILSQLYLDE